MGKSGTRIDKILDYLEKLNPTLQHIVKFFNTIMEERDQALEHSKGLQNIISETQKELSESKTLCSTMHECVLLSEVNYILTLNRFQIILMKLFLKEDILVTEVLPLVKLVNQITTAMVEKNLTSTHAYTVEYQRRFKIVVASRIKKYQEADRSLINGHAMSSPGTVELYREL